MEVSLRGEFIGEFINGTPCSTNLLTHLDRTTFLPGTVAKFDGRDDGEEEQEDSDEKVRMGACYKAPLNAQVTGDYIPDFQK